MRNITRYTSLIFPTNWIALLSLFISYRFIRFALINKVNADVDIRGLSDSTYKEKTGWKHVHCLKKVQLRDAFRFNWMRFVVVFFSAIRVTACSGVIYQVVADNRTFAYLRHMWQPASLTRSPGSTFWVTLKCLLPLYSFHELRQDLD